MTKKKRPSIEEAERRQLITAVRLARKRAFKAREKAQAAQIEYAREIVRAMQVARLASNFSMMDVARSLGLPDQTSLYGVVKNASRYTTLDAHNQEDEDGGDRL